MNAAWHAVIQLTLACLAHPATQSCACVCQLRVIVYVCMCVRGRVSSLCMFTCRRVLKTQRIIVEDMLEGRCALKPNKDLMTTMIYRALLKRRLCTLVASKFKGPDGAAKQEEGMSPATVLSTVFGVRELLLV